MDTIIYCPSCKKYLAIADAEDNTLHKRECKYCRKWIWYTPSMRWVETHKTPERTSSSGKRFY